MSPEEVKLSVSDFITRLKEKRRRERMVKECERDTVASDDFAHRIARSMVNDLRGVSDNEDILWSHADDATLPENSEITEDGVLSRLDLEKKLNAVEQSLAEEKGKDEWLARTAAKNTVDKFLNEADLRGRIESGEVDPEVLENLIEAIRKSEKSNVDTVNTVENDVMKKLTPRRHQRTRTKRERVAMFKQKETNQRNRTECLSMIYSTFPWTGWTLATTRRRRERKSSSSLVVVAVAIVATATRRRVTKKQKK